MFGLLPRLGGLTRGAARPAGHRSGEGGRDQPSARVAGPVRAVRAFLTSFGFAAGDLLFDLLSLDLVFLALRYQPGFGPLAVAYAAANIASAIPVTPAG